MRATVRAKYERMVAGRASPTHGKASTYNNYACRCPACTAAHSEWCAEKRAVRRRRLRLGLVDVEHGTTSTYANYDCRCDRCRAARAEYMARSAARRTRGEPS